MHPVCICGTWHATWTQRACHQVSWSALHVNCMHTLHAHSDAALHVTCMHTLMQSSRSQIRCTHRFYELSGHYPEAITVVSYNLKKDRFRGLHRAALRWPEGRFKFVGSELPAAAAEGAAKGEVCYIKAPLQHFFCWRCSCCCYYCCCCCCCWCYIW